MTAKQIVERLIERTNCSLVRPPVEWELLKQAATLIAAQAKRIEELEKDCERLRAAPKSTERGDNPTTAPTK